MPDDTTSKTKLTPQRVFLLVFFGIALLLSLTTIIGSFDVWQENGAQANSVQENSAQETGIPPQTAPED